MIGVLVISHGPLAEALLIAVQSLVGRMEKVQGISIFPNENLSELKGQIQRKVREMDEGDGVLILTDMFGGTPTHLSLSSLEKEKIEVITGVNIPMLLALSSYRRGRSLKELGTLVKKSGRRSIISAKELIEGKRLIRKKETP